MLSSQRFEREKVNINGKLVAEVWFPFVPELVCVFVRKNVGETQTQSSIIISNVQTGTYGIVSLIYLFFKLKL